MTCYECSCIVDYLLSLRFVFLQIGQTYCVGLFYRMKQAVIIYKRFIFCVNAASVLAYMADEVFGVACHIFGERENKILVELLEKIILQLVSRHFGKLLDYRYVIFNRILLVGIFFSDVAFDEL